MDSNQFKPPVRRSMTDAELQDALGNSQADEAGILKAMELLESQAQLRDIEKMEHAAWLLEMEQIGSPESLLAIENAKRSQQGLEALEALPASQPAVEDVVANLNAMFGAQSPEQSFEPAQITEPEDTSAPAPAPFNLVEAVTHESAVIEPIEATDAFTEFFTEIENEEAQDAPEPVSVASANIEAFDMVIGAEDELTALEEQALEQVADLVPVEVVFEEDSFVDFLTRDEPVVEEVALESAPKLSRRSRAISQFWAWLGLSGSVLLLVFASFLNGLDLSFTQLSLGVGLGLSASGAVIAIGTLAGKRSGLPTIMISRAAFGVHGNYLPGSVLLLSRLFWTTAIIGSAIVISFPSGLQFETLGVANTGSYVILAIIALVIAAGIALAIFGGRVLYRAQQVSGLLGLVAVASWFVVNSPKFSASALIAHANGSWLTTFSVAILIFAIFGLVWSSASADFARKLHVSVYGIRVIGWGLLALVAVPATILIGALAILRSGSLESPAWLTSALLIGGAVSLVVWLGMSLYSTNLSLHSIGLKISPAIAQPLLGIILGGAAVFAVLHLQTSGFWFNLHGYALAFAVPVAAWTGIFVADILIRRIAYHEISLSRGYGFYKSVNWFNLSGWIIATVVGLGLSYSDLIEFQFFGFIADNLVNQQFWRDSSFAIVIAFAIGLLLPVVFGIPRIKRQEAEVLNIEARRNDLKDVLGLVD